MHARAHLRRRRGADRGAAGPRRHARAAWQGPCTAAVGASAPSAADGRAVANWRGALAGRRETLIVCVALLVIALSVLDDAFVHREPGTGVGDHLLSGLVPAAAAVAVAVAYPRLGAGLRATLLLVCVPVAIVAGVVDGLRHVLVDRLAGDD